MTTRSRTHLTTGILLILFLVFSLMATDPSAAASKTKVKMNKCKVTLAYKSITYDGKKHKPKVVVTYKGKTVSKKNYRVSYKKAKGPGKATVTVTGRKGFTGKVKKNYTIKVGAPSDPVIRYDGDDDAKAGTSIELSWTPPAKCKSYAVTAYKDGHAIGGQPYSVKQPAFSFRDLTGPGKYDFRICAVAGSDMTSPTIRTGVYAGHLPQTITLKETSFVSPIGTTKTISASAKTAVRYESKDTSVAEVSSSGVISFVRPGTTEITVTAERATKGGINYRQASETVSITSLNLSIPALSGDGPGYRRVDLSWNSIAGADGYEIRETQVDGTENTITIDDGDTTSTSLKSKTNGKRPVDYVYSMRAFSVLDGETYYSDWSPEVTVTARIAKVGEAATGDHSGSGGANVAGDQKGNEVRIKDWYYSSTSSSYSHWTHVLRFKDPAQAEAAAKVMEAVCNNDRIGYDNSTQNKRITKLYKAAKAAGWDCSAIDTKCDTACSQLVALCVKIAVFPNDDSKDYAWCDVNAKNMLSKLKGLNSVFNVYTDRKQYLSTDENLQRGDILVTVHSDGSNHTCMVL